MRILLRAAAILVISAPAFAQDRDDGRGVRAGAFIISPEIGLKQSYDSNIFAEESGATDSFITTLDPSVSIVSDFSRHRVAVRTYVSQDFFLNSSDDNQTLFGASAQGVLDVTRRLRVVADARFDRESERRGSDEVDPLNPATVNLPGPVLSNNYAFGLKTEYDFSDFRLTPFVGFERENFRDSGTVINQDDRDRRIYRAGAELSYTVATGYDAFIRSNYFNTDFDAAVDDDDGLNRDSQGVETTAGVRLRLSRLLTGSLGAGFTVNRFESQFRDDTVDFTVRAGLGWTPTRRIALNFDAVREVTPTNIPGASDRTDTDVFLGGRYEILRTLDGFATLGMERQSFNGIDRTDTALFGRFGLDWELTRQISLEASYGYTQEFSDIPTEEFSKHVVTVGARYGL